MMPECLAVMMVNLLLFANVFAAVYPQQNACSASDQITWSINIPVAQEPVALAEIETYNERAAFHAIKKALGCEDDAVKAIISQLWSPGGLYG